ncbi:hypothetical protein P8452_55510 [Trifolium repens]|nr:hypothetical protein P8452_55510 [Trifolium repens]
MLHSLEELNLNDCTSLESFSHVVGLGEKLKTMSVRSCFKLRSIPPLKLTSLEELDLTNCTSLQNFPLVVDEFLGKLKILLLENCHNLKSIPPLKLDVLEKLDLSNCYMLKSFPLVFVDKDTFTVTTRTLSQSAPERLLPGFDVKLQKMTAQKPRSCFKPAKRVLEFTVTEGKIKILEKIVPDWICKKLVSSGDTMYCIKNAVDLESIRSRLVSNVTEGDE